MLGMVTLLTLVRVSAMMVGEVFGMFVGVPPMPVARKGEWEDQQQQERVLSSIASEKLLAVTEEVTAGLELWRNAVTAEAGEGKSAAEVATRLMGEFEGVQQAVRELQASFAKSRSVGSVVGVVSWDLEKSQASLKDEHKAVAMQNREVHELARRTIKEHENHGGFETTVGVVDRVPELMKKTQADLANFNNEELQARLRETEGIVEAGLDIDEAELLVARYVDAVAAAAGAAQARSGGAGDTADEEIEEVVKEVLRSVDVTGPPDGCVSVSLAKDLTKAQLERFGADQTGIPDYAMGPAGARVIPNLTSATYEAPMSMLEKVRSLGRKNSAQDVSQPAIAINPESRLGRCWPMKGYRGALAVRLSEPINIESISIEHAPRELLLNGGISALKDFLIIGYPKGWVPGGSDMGDVLVGGGEYRLDGDVIQFFDVAEEYRGVEYAAVALEVESNHGEGAYTCIYRLRVHGSPAP